MKIAFNSPCVGVGGADAFMLGLMNHLRTIDVVGLSVHNQTSSVHDRWLKRIYRGKIYQKNHNCQDKFENISYVDGEFGYIDKAIKHADAVVSWGTHGPKHIKAVSNRMVVDFAQNTDNYFEEITLQNDKYVDYRVACSHSCIRVFPLDKREKVKVIYNGIDPSRVAPRFGRSATRHKYGIPDEGKVLLFMGRFCSEKYPESVIQCIAKLPTNWIGVFCGTGELKDLLENEAARYAPSRIAFVEPQYDVGDILAMADCFILPTDFEGHPLAWCEALLAGTPTVVTNIPVMRELRVKHGDLAAYVQRRAGTEELVKAIEMTQTNRFQGIVNQAREVCWQNWTLPTIAAQWEEFLYSSFEEYKFLQRHPKLKIIAGQKPHSRVPDDELAQDKELNESQS